MTESVTTLRGATRGKSKINIATKINRFKKNPKKYTGLLILGLILLTTIFYLYKTKEDSNININNKAVVVSNSEVLNNVAVITEIPYDETPVIATVKDIEKLNNQTFFSRAQNGDKLLIFKKAKRAILYRPYNNKIIETMTIKLGDDEILNEENIVENLTEPIKVSIYNSTTTPGLAAGLSTKLESEFSEFKFQITNVDNAQGNYEKTRIVNNNNINTETINKIVQFVDGEVSELPTNESTDTADILIFIGTDYTE